MREHRPAAVQQVRQQPLLGVQPGVTVLLVHVHRPAEDHFTVVSEGSAAPPHPR